MNSIRSLIVARLVAIGLLTFSAALAAQTTGDASAPVPATASVPSSKLVSNFSDFAGSPENATALVNGLRTGTPIVLTDTTIPPGQAPVTTTFSPGTKPMGYGNVRIALSLSRAQLASQGITNPTPEQLQGSLLGNTATGGTEQGILQMRAAGMGWGKIANSMGFKLGSVMSGKQPTATTPAYGTASTARTTSAAKQGGYQSGISTAHGRQPPSTTKHTGITTAAGGRGNQVTSGLGQGGGQGNAGAVNAAGVRGNSAAGSHGNAYGKGGKP